LPAACQALSLVHPDLFAMSNRWFISAMSHAGQDSNLGGCFSSGLTEPPAVAYLYSITTNDVPFL
jgi:hypothetical protein